MSDVSRRTFGQTIGAAALAGAWPVAGAEQAGGSVDLHYLSATELAARIRSKQVSAREVLSAHLAQIERVNPKVNAIVTLVAERAMADAARADDLQARGQSLGALHGLPVAHKDLVDTAGIRTTRGSPFYRDHVPTRDALIVSRLRAAGAITCGKTNTPEFGAGSQTFNAIFGATRNPYDLDEDLRRKQRGAAVALACGMVPIADGSDTGGSLRNPAAFCNIVGFRPSPGRVPRGVGSWSPLSVSGPMARSVADLALFLSAMAGPDAAQFALHRRGRRAVPCPARRGVSRAYASRGGGISAAFHSKPEIRRVVDANRRAFEDLGCVVEEAETEFCGRRRGVPDVALRVQLRAVRAAGARAARVGEGHDQVRGRPGRAADWRRHREARWPGRRGCTSRATSSSVGTTTSSCRSRRWRRSTCQRRIRRRLPDTPMATYIDWMRSCWYVTFMSNPAISVPGGFTPSGLPVGVQIVGRHRDDWSVLQLAHAFEQATRHGQRRPPVALP